MMFVLAAVEKSSRSATGRKYHMASRRSQFEAILKRSLPLFGMAILAIAVQFIEYPYQRVAGNECEGLNNWCYEPGWKLGLPFAWMQGSKVSAAVSIIRGGTFILDVALCSLAFLLIYLLWKKVTLKKPKP